MVPRVRRGTTASGQKRVRRPDAQMAHTDPVSPTLPKNKQRRKQLDQPVLIYEDPGPFFSVAQSQASLLWLAYRLLTSGDIEPNPGSPKTKQKTLANKISTNSTIYISS